MSFLIFQSYCFLFSKSSIWDIKAGYSGNTDGIDTYVIVTNLYLRCPFYSQYLKKHRNLTDLCLPSSKTFKSRQCLMAIQSKFLVKCFNHKVNTFSSPGEFKCILHKWNLTVCVGNGPGNLNLQCRAYEAVKTILTPQSCQGVVYSIWGKALPEVNRILRANLGLQLPS